MFIPKKMVIRGKLTHPHISINVGFHQHRLRKQATTTAGKPGRQPIWNLYITNHKSPRHFGARFHGTGLPLRRTGKRNVQTGKGQFLAQELDSSRMTKNCGLLSLQNLTHIQDLFKSFGLLSRIPEKPTSPFLTVGF